MSSSRSFGKASPMRKFRSSTRMATPDRQTWTSASTMARSGPAGVATSTKTIHSIGVSWRWASGYSRMYPTSGEAVGGFRSSRPFVGGEVAPARCPEIGIAKDIKVRSLDFSKTLYRGKPNTFDAPAHHFDETARLPREFEIVAENATTLQAVVSKDRRISCTQYHPELPYDYIAKLMLHWASNYTSMFAEDEFQNLLESLKKKECEEKSFRKIEFRNWLEGVRRGG